MATEMTPEDTLDALASGNAPVLETLVQMNLDTLENSGLDARTYFVARAAALVALDAAPVSYLVNLAAASDVLQPGDVRGTLVAIAPVVGSARVVSAAGSLARALGIAVTAAESEVQP
jgi:4-carboxymuconolactone decarboxylase